jgi:CheY-like chemotaxis protein
VISALLLNPDIVAPCAPSDPTSDAEEHNAVLHGKTILVVDDDVRNLYALTNALEDFGLTILMAVNGKGALEQLAEHPDIRLVVMDIMMPEMDGYEAIQEIRKQEAFRNLPIVALTAKAMKQEQDKCRAAGANDYLTKPVDLEKLVSLLRIWLSSET